MIFVIVVIVVLALMDKAPCTDCGQPKVVKLRQDSQSATLGEMTPSDTRGRSGVPLV